MYLFKWLNVFVQMAKCICPDCKMYLYKLQNIFVQIAKVFVQMAKCICPNGQKYLSRLQNVFVQMAQCICPYYKTELLQVEASSSNSQLIGQQIPHNAGLTFITCRSLVVL